MRVAKLTLLVMLLVAAMSMTLSAVGWQSDVAKTWKFNLPQGALKIGLYVDPTAPHVSTVLLWYEGGASPSVAEEAGFIRQILRQLPELGVDPHSISSITMRGCVEPEVQQRLGTAALHSQPWRSRKKSPERLMEDLLNSLGAYNGFNSAFEEYGLAVSRVAGVEKMGTRRCKDLKVTDSACTAHPNTQVPAGANLYVEIVPISKDQEKVPTAARGKTR